MRLRSDKNGLVLFYWRSVIQPNGRAALLIAILMLLSAVFHMITIGLAVPLLEAVRGGEGRRDSRVVQISEDVLRTIGISPSDNIVIFAILAFASFIFVAHSGFTLIHQYLSAATAERLKRDTKFKIFQTFLHGRYADVAQHGRGAIIQDLTGPPGAIYTAIIRMSAMFTALFNSVVLLALMLYLSWWATLIIGVVAIIGIQGLRQVMDQRAQSAGRLLYQVQTDESRITVDAIDGLKIVKAYGLEQKLTARLGTLLQAEIRPSLRLAFFRYLPAFSNEFVASVIILILGGITLLRPATGMGFPSLVAFLMAIRQCGASFASINSLIVELETQRRSIEVANELSDLVPREKSGSKPIQTVSQIRLTDVCISYDSQQEILHNVSITMKKGTVTAIVGPTGAGKSTIANLIVGLFRPSSGTIQVDDMDLRDLNLTAWRSKIGYVSQDPFLFNASVRDNIALWESSFSQAEIEWAAELAQLHDFVKTLPDGYSTVVGDRGLKLSGGQCQRIAIARAILFKPQVLVFDEATSALDNLTEKAVYYAMSALRANAIVVAIAHRLSTVRDADQIIVLKSGRIVEEGTHDRLLLEGGSYSKLYETESVRG